MKKRSITFMLTILLSMLGVQTFAHDIEVANEDGVTIYYTFINNGSELAVSFRGSSFSSYDNEYSGNLVIPETVTYDGKKYIVTGIVSWAFSFCSGLTDIIIPNTVINIGSSAFYRTGWISNQPEGVVYAGKVACGYKGTMPAHANIVLEEGTLGIAADSFNKSSNLTSITIPNSVQIIGASAFEGCSELSSVSIGNSVTKIEDRAFAVCRSLESIIIPNTVTDIGKEAFIACDRLKEVTMSKSLETIKDKTFNDCKNLKSITIPNTVTNIGISAFNGCDNLTNVSLSSSLINIDDYAFYGCKSLTSLIIPDLVTNIGICAFSGCSGLTNIVLGKSVTSIKMESFLNCSALRSINIPYFMTDIGTRAFEGCSSLTNVTFNCKEIGYWFNGNTILENVIIGDKVTSIGHGAFSGCSGMTSISIPNTVTSIGNYVFKGCTSLKNVTISDAVTVLGNNTFQGCKRLESVTIPNSVTSIGDYAFDGCSRLTSITIPNSVSSIGNFTFTNCPLLESVTIGTGVLSIGRNFFTDSYYDSHRPAKVFWLPNTPPTGYNNAAGGVNYVANDSYSFSNKTIYKFLSSKFEIDGIIYVPISISDRICDIVDCLYNESTEKIIIGESVEYKGVSMKVNQVHPYAFFGNRFVKNVQFDFTGAISNYAFGLCENLEILTICDKVTSIGQSAFSGCKTLSLIEIPQSVTQIGNYAFQNCTALKDVFMSDRSTILTLGSNGSSPLFNDCPLDSVYIGGNISYNVNKNSGYSPFYRNTSLRTVHITDEETEISENEFYGCTGLKNVKIGDGVETIGNWAFSGCASLDYFQFGGSVETIGQEAFSDCVAVTKVISRSATPPICGSQALDDLNKWQCTLEVPKGMSGEYQKADQWREFFFIEEGAPPIYKEDLDGNGIVDKEDVTLLVNVILGKDVIQTGKKGDLNKDGFVNMADVTKLIDFILGQ